MLRGTTIALNLQFTKNHRFTFSGKSLNMFFSNHVRGFRLRIRTDCICFFHLFNKNIFQEQHPSGKSYFVGGGLKNQQKTNGKPMFILQNLSGPPGAPVLGQVLPQNVEAPHRAPAGWFFQQKKLGFWALKLRGSCLVGL
jgi:hypothetical protein